MVKQEGLGGAQDPHLWERALEEMGAPEINEVYIREVYSARNKFVEASEGRGCLSLGKVNDVKTLLKTEIGPEDPIIRGSVEIARGKKLILGITPDQIDALAIVYSMDLDSEVSYYASIENPRNSQKEEVEALIIYCDIMPASIDNLIISRALAKKLRIKKDQDIKILSVYRKTSDINLDEL